MIYDKIWYGGRPFVIVHGLVMLRGTIGQPGYLYFHRKIRIVYQFPTVRRSSLNGISPKNIITHKVTFWLPTIVKKKVNTSSFTIIPTYFPSQSGRFSYQFFKAQVTVIVVWPLFKPKSIKTTLHIKIHQISYVLSKNP